MAKAGPTFTRKDNNNMTKYPDSTDDIIVILYNILEQLETMNDHLATLAKTEKG